MAKTQLPAPPIEIPTELLCALSRSVSKNDGVSLILRGSFLLKHWFGPLARPAADLDLECFQRARSATYDRFGTPLNYAKSLCMYAAQSGHGFSAPIEFTEVGVPNDGTSLWDYGTPGERCYTGWVWNARERMSGILQIDIAEAGSYDLEFVSTAEIRLEDANGTSCMVPAYTQEMLLAAKLSWIVRGVNQHDGSSASTGSFEPKDLFDAHLLVTQSEVRSDEFERAMLAVGAEDKLDWKTLEKITSAPPALTGSDSVKWDEFRHAYPDMVKFEPVEMLCTIVERLRPLLSGLIAHAPFFLAIKADPADEVPYLIYADWLQERGDTRGVFLRLFIRWYFHEEPSPSLGGQFQRVVKRLFRKGDESTQEQIDCRQALRSALQKMSTPWLYHVFGSAERFREFKQKIEA